MKLIELLQPEVLNELSFPEEDEAINTLINAGYKIIGSGLNAKVLGDENSDKVVKVFNSRDRGYMEFANLARNSNNPHFPKLGKVWKIDNFYSVVRIERLTRFPRSDPSISSPIKTYLKYKMGELSLEDLDIPAITKSFESQPHMQAALDSIAELGNAHKFKSDIHAGNLMLRGSTVVILEAFF